QAESSRSPASRRIWEWWLSRSLRLLSPSLGSPCRRSRPSRLLPFHSDRRSRSGEACMAASPVDSPNSAFQPWASLTIAPKRLRPVSRRSCPADLPEQRRRSAPRCTRSVEPTLSRGPVSLSYRPSQREWCWLRKFVLDRGKLRNPWPSFGILGELRSSCGSNRPFVLLRS